MTRRTVLVEFQLLQKEDKKTKKKKKKKKKWRGSRRGDCTMTLCQLGRGGGFFTTREFRMFTDYKIKFGEERGCGGRGGGVTN